MSKTQLPPPDRRYASHADPNRLVRMEESIAELIQGADSEKYERLSDDDYELLGQHILKLVLREFRPDLIPSE